MTLAPEMLQELKAYWEVIALEFGGTPAEEWDGPRGGLAFTFRFPDGTDVIYTFGSAEQAFRAAGDLAGITGFELRFWPAGEDIPEAPEKRPIGFLSER